MNELNHNKSENSLFEEGGCLWLTGDVHSRRKIAKNHSKPQQTTTIHSENPPLTPPKRGMKKQTHEKGNNGAALNETNKYFNERINPLREPTPYLPPKRDKLSQEGNEKIKP